SFAATIGNIALQLRQAFTAEEIDAYHLVLAEETDPEEWAAFCRGAVKRHGWRFMPAVPELLAALAAFRGDRPLNVEAVVAYERVLEAGTWTYAGGTAWDYRAVRKACGEAAAQAFLAAGGSSAFRTTYKETDRRNAFVTAYVEAARAQPAARLLP